MHEGSKMIQRVCKCLLKITGAGYCLRKELQRWKVSENPEGVGWTWRYELGIL